MIVEPEAQKKEDEEEKDPEEHELHIHKFPGGGAMIGVNRGKAFISINVSLGEYLVLFGAVLHGVDVLAGNNDEIVFVLHKVAADGKQATRIGVAVRDMAGAFWGPFMEREEMLRFMRTGCPVDGDGHKPQAREDEPVN